MSPGPFLMQRLMRLIPSPCLELAITSTTVERSWDVFKMRPGLLPDCSSETLSYICWVSDEASEEEATTSWHFLTKVKACQKFPLFASPGLILSIIQSDWPWTNHNMGNMQLMFVLWCPKSVFLSFCSWCPYLFHLSLLTTLNFRDNYTDKFFSRPDN